MYTFDRTIYKLKLHNKPHLTDIKVIPKTRNSDIAT